MGRRTSTHVVFDTVEFLGRLAGLVPRPRVNLILYYGVLACPRCGGRLRLIALIEEAAVIDWILRHLGLPTALPVARPARAPPLVDGLLDVAGEADTHVFESGS